jgi:hypothetical protein
MIIKLFFLQNIVSHVQSIRKCFPVTTTQAPIDSTTQAAQNESTPQTGSSADFNNLTELLDEVFELQAQIETYLIYLDGNDTVLHVTTQKLIPIVDDLLEDKTIPSDTAKILQDFAALLKNDTTTPTTLVRKKRATGVSKE